MRPTMRLLRVPAFAALFAAAAASAAPAPASAPPGKASAAPYTEGVNYLTVLPAQPTSVNPGQIEVIEFFWYGCPSCFQLEPHLEAWERSKPANVVLKRVPAIIRPDAEGAARAFYTAEILGLNAHEDIFNEIHLNHDLMVNEADFERFFMQKYNVDPKRFESIWESQAVSQKVADARVLATRYKVVQFGQPVTVQDLGTPVLVVNGKWITGGGMKLPYSQIMLAVNWLIQQEQAALPPATH
jgi:thiol:disulfide interchange protein DsbA